jgi:Na+/melibiose symporter-like transporter
MLRALGNLLVIGWFILLVKLYFRALFHPQYFIVTWILTIIGICVILWYPPQECNVCLDGGFIDGK